MIHIREFFCFKVSRTCEIRVTAFNLYWLVV